MNKPTLEERWISPLHPGWVLGIGLVLLGLLYGLQQALHQAAQDATRDSEAMEAMREATGAALDHVTMFRDLKEQDVEQLKLEFSSAAVTNKSLFESGLSLQEERRLLEKQLEILTTSLYINPALQRIFLMRADEPLNSFLISYIPPRYFGIISTGTIVPNSVRIVSKERFAAPERGKSEIIDGKLQWVPPQVGTSVRSRALGEFVMFTNSPLILHGRPVDSEAHEQFLHLCIGLDTDAARRLYRGSFIGTRITLNSTPVNHAAE